MGKFFQHIILFSIASLMLVNCRKKQWDEYYGRPDWLEPPVYQQLQAKGNFKNLLACIDKAGYANTLGKAGYWTLFAPNDIAFQEYFTANGITGVSDMDSATCRNIITYALVYNAFNKDRLDDYQSAAGWVEDNAFKRRTANYTGVYAESVNGQTLHVIASNRNNNGANNGFVFGDNNNKYLPFFIDNFFTANGLSATDYTYFYPGSTYSGFNIANAKVVTADIPAENGMIHEVDKVIVPLPSIDQYLASQPAFSEFKKLYDKYMVSYNMNADATHLYQVLTGSGDPVYVKTYNAQLAFSPNNENFLKQQDNDGQSDGFTLFAPQNDSVLKYINDVLLEFYPSLDQAPLQITIDFLNAHMWPTTVWPGKFKTTFNTLGEEARFDPATNVQDKKMLSNGIFYGTNKVQEANVFSTVYARAYLDPKYSLMTRALNEDLRFAISNPGLRFTVFMMSDSVLRAEGFDFNILRNEWNYTNGSGVVTAGNAARDRLQRILNTHVVFTSGGELDDLSGQGILPSYNGEYIKYNNYEVYASGNIDSNNTVQVSGSRLYKNGIVYYTDRLLTFSEQNIGKHIEQLGSAPASSFNYFWNYLRNTAVYNIGSGEILGTLPGVFYTVLIPDNNAIQQAVDDGWLPGSGTAPGKTPNFNPGSSDDKEKVIKFLLYHIVGKKNVVPNGLEFGTFETLLKNISGEATTVFGTNAPGALSFTDNFGGMAQVKTDSSNNLSNRTIIHLLDNYLKYNDQ